MSLYHDSNQPDFGRGDCPRRLNGVCTIHLDGDGQSLATLSALAVECGFDPADAVIALTEDGIYPDGSGSDYPQLWLDFPSLRCPYCIERRARRNGEFPDR